GRRGVLQYVSTVGVVGIAGLDATLLANRVDGSVGRNQGQVVAQTIVNGQVRSRLPGVLEKRTEQPTESRLLVDIAAVGVVYDAQEQRCQTKAAFAIGVIGLGGIEAKLVIRNRTGEPAGNVACAKL